MCETARNESTHDVNDVIVCNRFLVLFSFYV